MPTDTQTTGYAAPALHLAETAEQHIARVAAREAVRQRMALLQRALARLDTIGLTVRSVELRTEVPVIEIAPNWRTGALGLAKVVKATPTHRMRRVDDVHGCRIEWVEPVERPLAVA
ncbi:hypothetical protein THICB3320735 [Thiomonas sp. CB3]|nr:hypothetical protein THICB3320735 [Thiomonas sp. CB3]